MLVDMFKCNVSTHEKCAYICIHMCIVDVRLTSANIALLVLGVILLCVAIALCVVLVLVEIISHKGICI